jgi:alpha-beta hydrolase superfamily lysophospholipase
MPLRSRSLRIFCEGLELQGGVCLPPAPRGVVVLVHGLPSADPPDPGDDGYAGFARRFAESGWAGVWADLRGARASPGWFSIEGWVRDARAVVEAARTLDGLSDLPTALVGSSAGGAVSVEAARRGAPVDALVLLASPADWVTLADDAAAGDRKSVV